MRRPLMRRVAGSETGRHRKAGDFGAKLVQRCGQCGKIKRGHFGPGMSMPTRQGNDRIAAQGLGQAGAGQFGRIKADKDQRHTAALPFDQRIGGQGGGQ